MYLYTADEFEGELTECNEGELKWIKKEEIEKLNLWEGDRIFLKRLKRDDSFFTMKIEYNGDKLIKYQWGGDF